MITSAYYSKFSERRDGKQIFLKNSEAIIEMLMDCWSIEISASVDWDCELLKSLYIFNSN